MRNLLQLAFFITPGFWDFHADQRECTVIGDERVVEIDPDSHGR
jgi:hypothetical protein